MSTATLYTIIAFLAITNGVLALIVFATAPMASRYHKTASRYHEIKREIFKRYKGMRTMPGEDNMKGNLYYDDPAYPAISYLYEKMLKNEGRNPKKDRIIQMRSRGVYPPETGVI